MFAGHQQTAEVLSRVGPTRSTDMVAHVLLPVLLAAPQSDRVVSLPGWTGALPSAQYSGFLNISGGKHVHYWFAEAEGSAAEAEGSAAAPVVLWVQGGPGGSSITGMWTENMGPYTLATSMARFPTAAPRSGRAVLACLSRTRPRATTGRGHSPTGRSPAVSCSTRMTSHT